MEHVRIENTGTNEAIPVNVVAGGAGDGNILDGVNTGIKATVKDLTNSNPLTVAIVDGVGDQITAFGGGTQYTEGDIDATITGTAMMMEVAANTLQPVQGTVVDGILVNLGANNDVTVAGVATAANQTTGNTSLATIAGAVAGTEMQVDVLTLPNVTLAAGTNTNEVVGDVAHSIAASGNPVLVAGVSQAHDDTAPPNRVDAEGDATRLATDYDGSLFVRPHGPQVWTYHLNTSTAQTDTVVHAAPGAGLSLYVGTIVFSSGAATAINMFLEEGATTVVGPYYLEAVAGRGMAVQFNPPRKITANTALTLTTSASIAHSVDITGFTAQG